MAIWERELTAMKAASEPMLICHCASCQWISIEDLFIQRELTRESKVVMRMETMTALNGTFHPGLTVASVLEKGRPAAIVSQHAEAKSPTEYERNEVCGRTSVSGKRPNLPTGRGNFAEAGAYKGDHDDCRHDIGASIATSRIQKHSDEWRSRGDNGLEVAQGEDEGDAHDQHHARVDPHAQ